jgi:hypothetical protein
MNFHLLWIVPKIVYLVLLKWDIPKFTSLNNITHTNLVHHVLWNTTLLFVHVVLQNQDLDLFIHCL